ncbi:MAG: YdiU family protein [Gammaproteobacteria bacterium]|nr:YdiU family protein [Gammaproteobacteria bacterium]
MWNLENTYASLNPGLYARQAPTPVSEPHWVLTNPALAESLGLDPTALQGDQLLAICAGNALPPGSVPLAQAYAGHQFGNFTILGDGRAVLLGEQRTPSGDLFDIQLKGSGPTPFSRSGDGRATLGAMLREFIISEALHGLGIATTRSLAVIASGETVYRQHAEPGAVLVRTAASHIRVGTFEYAIRQGGAERVRELADYCIDRHYPDCRQADNRYLALLDAVIQRQANLIAQWMQVGFIHGVMNTDNMTLCGESIDFGPCAFMDEYAAATVYSSIDRQGRYAYNNQPAIGQWNLARLAECLLPLLAEEQATAISLAQDALGSYVDSYQHAWLQGMGRKLGLSNASSEDRPLVEDWLTLLEQHKADFTNSFRALAGDADSLAELPAQPLFDQPAFSQWRQRWQARLAAQALDQTAVTAVMQAHNPQVIARNHQVERALQAASQSGDLQPCNQLLSHLRQPFSSNAGMANYCLPPRAEERVQATFCGT